jgi:hypothetical protein
MSTTTIPVPQTRTSLDPVAFVTELADAEKHAVLLALLREAMALNGDSGQILVVDEHRRPFGYYVTPKAADELYRRNGPQLTESEEAALDELLANPGPTVPIGEVIEDLKRQLADLRQQQ